MLELPTKITINGAEGDRFLSSLAGYAAPLPQALHRLAEQRSVEVDSADAELVEEFVEDLLSSGWLDVDQPLLFSPRVGDEVVVRYDVLAEGARSGPALPHIWRFLEAGTRGKLIGWRDRAGEPSRAVVDVIGAERRLVVFVGEHHVTRAPRR